MNSYRVWDRVEECWLTDKDKVFLNYNGELVKVGKLGRIKTLNQQRYILHNDIGVTDTNDKYVYEGDFVELFFPTPDRNEFEKSVICTIAYVPEFSTYVFMSVADGVIYPINPTYVVRHMGNVFDTPEIVEELNPKLAEQVKQMKTFTELEVDNTEEQTEKKEVSADE